MPLRKPSTRQIGQHMEQRASDYLIHKGLKLVQRNYCCHCGEIDLVMQDGQTLVFVEVRYRRHLHYGGPLESITAQKQNKLIRAASYYLQTHRLIDKVPVRFDVVALSEPSESHMVWLKNAIEHGE